MYHIVIGDDDPLFLEEAERLVSACMDGERLECGKDYTIDCYSSASSMMKALGEDKERCQLCLLDVEFGKDNGLQLAAALREQTEEFSLIYITSHRDYVFQSFDTRPLHYLLKPVDRGKLESLIRDDYRRRYLGEKLYLKAGGKHMAVAYQDIYAVEAAQHRVFLHLRERTVEWGGSLSALAPELPVRYFCRCHNSYFVNFSHMTEMVRYEARLENGEIIPVRKRLYKSAIEQFIAFLKN